MEKKSLHEKVIEIQSLLEVPKDKENEFANFKYRNLDQIEAKLKPLLKERNLVLTFTDEVVAVGDRVYVKAYAILTDGETTLQVTGFAREAVTPRAKTDDSQLTGACSTYARKTAVCGMFLIYDTDDADSKNNSERKKINTVKDDFEI